MCARAHTLWCICGGERTTCRSQFFFSNMWVPEIELGSSGLAAIYYLAPLPTKPSQKPEHSPQSNTVSFRDTRPPPLVVKEEMVAS